MTPLVIKCVIGFSVGLVIGWFIRRDRVDRQVKRRIVQRNLDLIESERQRIARIRDQKLLTHKEIR